MSAQEKAEQQLEELPTHLRADPNALRPVEQVRRTWWHTARAGTPPERMLDSQYWSRCIHNMTAGGIDQPPDRIECMAADRSWFVELMVLGVGAEEVEVIQVAGKVLPDRRAALGKRGPAGTNLEDFGIEDLGPGEGHRVVRFDGVEMFKHSSREQCRLWITRHLKTVRK